VLIRKTFGMNLLVYQDRLCNLGVGGIGQNDDSGHGTLPYTFWNATKGLLLCCAWGKREARKQGPFRQMAAVQSMRRPLSLKGEIAVLFADSYTATFAGDSSYRGSTASAPALELGTPPGGHR
jgi:hypothetical protein